MDVAIHRRKMTSLRRQAKFFRNLSMVLGLAVILQAATVAVLGNASERIVIVPPEVNGEFWVEERKVSKRYFLEWGHYLATLLLNMTPESAAYQGEVLLRHVAPAHRAEFSRRLAVAGERMRKERLSTFFNVTEVRVEPERSRVAFIGTLASYVEGRRISEHAAAYMAAFRVHRGRLQLLEFIETSPLAAFAPAKV